jgi:hypothetical protein
LGAVAGRDGYKRAVAAEQKAGVEQNVAPTDPADGPSFRIRSRPE